MTAALSKSAPASAREAFLRILEIHVRLHQPRTAADFRRVRILAEDHYRLGRINALELSLMDRPAYRHAQAAIAEFPAVVRLAKKAGPQHAFAAHLAVAARLRTIRRQIKAARNQQLAGLAPNPTPNPAPILPSIPAPIPRPNPTPNPKELA